MTIDETYVALPWKAGGEDRSGVDCRGLALLWLREQMGFKAVATPASTARVEDFLQGAEFRQGNLQRGDIVFFRRGATKEIRHVGIYLGENRYLHILKGCESRIDTGVVLLARLGHVPAGAISPSEAERLCAALADPRIGETGTIILLVISVLLTLASIALAPKLARQGNKYGRYGQDALVTQNTPEIPLPDLLGSVVTAGNSPYTQLIDKSKVITSTTTQRWNKIVVLASAPSEEIDYQTGLEINGVSWSSQIFKNGTYIDGFRVDPAQTKTEAVTGSIAGDTNVPSITRYDGAHAIAVPVDVRAQYDRGFPVYGLSGCSYLVFRLIDSAKFPNFNMTCRVKCRKCRTFNSSGFIQTSVSGESLAGADAVKVRFKLAHEDIVSVGSLTVNAVSFAEISASAQTGNVYSLNRTKGYVEFIAAPAAAATITISYVYYPREWSQNPAMQTVYLLTEPGRGKGYPASKVDWPSAVALRDYCDELVPGRWQNGGGVAARYQSNYAVDFRKPIQEHLRAVLDSCYGYLFSSDGKFFMRARKADASVFSFTESNILVEGEGPEARSTFLSELVDRSDRANRLKVIFHSEESRNAETEVIIDDAFDQRERASRAGNNGVVDENLKFSSVISQAQAERLAELYLAEQVNSRWAVKFATTIKGLALQPGDLVDVTHTSQPNWAGKLFRLEGLSHDENDHLQLEASEYVPSAFA